MKKTIFILFLLNSLITPVLASDKNKEIKAYKDNLIMLASSKSIKCYFPQGILANWKGRNLKLITDKMSNAFHFDNIDVLKNKAHFRHVISGSFAFVFLFHTFQAIA